LGRPANCQSSDELRALYLKNVPKGNDPSQVHDSKHTYVWSETTSSYGDDILLLPGIIEKLGMRLFLLAEPDHVEIQRELVGKTWCFYRDDIGYPGPTDPGYPKLHMRGETDGTRWIQLWYRQGQIAPSGGAGMFPQTGKVQ
jgi:hypothetical protein